VTLSITPYQSQAAPESDLIAVANAMAQADNSGEAPLLPLALPLGAWAGTASLSLENGRILLALNDGEGRETTSRMPWPNARSLGLALLALGDAVGDLPSA